MFGGDSAAWANGSAVRRRIDDVWFEATVVDRGEPDRTGKLAKIVYADDGRTEFGVLVAECEVSAPSLPALVPRPLPPFTTTSPGALLLRRRTEFGAHLSPPPLATSLSPQHTCPRPWFDSSVAGAADAAFARWAKGYDAPSPTASAPYSAAAVLRRARQGCSARPGSDSSSGGGGGGGALGAEWAGWCARYQQVLVLERAAAEGSGGEGDSDGGSEVGGSRASADCEENNNNDKDKDDYSGADQRGYAGFPPLGAGIAHGGSSNRVSSRSRSNSSARKTGAGGWSEGGSSREGERGPVGALAALELGPWAAPGPW